MKTHIRKSTGIFIALLMLGTGSAWADNPVGKRQQRQYDRIRDGVSSGSLTKKEFEPLKMEQARIQAAKRYARADGRITRREDRWLDTMQDRAGRHIYRSTHNARTAGCPFWAPRRQPIQPQHRSGYHPPPQCRAQQPGYEQRHGGCSQSWFSFGGVISEPGFAFGLSAGGGR